MSKRQWPKVEWECCQYKNDIIFQLWCLNNLSKEELDRVATAIEEPITITKQKYFECLKESLMEEGLSYFTYKGIENIPDANVLSRIGSKLWKRLSK